jgi:hypothetical protein
MKLKELHFLIYLSHRFETAKDFSVENDNNHYNNGAVMTSFKDKLFCM